MSEYCLTTYNTVLLNASVHLYNPSVNLHKTAFVYIHNSTIMLTCVLHSLYRRCLSLTYQYSAHFHHTLLFNYLLNSSIVRIIIFYNASDYRFNFAFVICLFSWRTLRPFNQAKVSKASKSK